MTEHVTSGHAAFGDPAILISSGTHPKTFSDLDMLHKDPMYELVTGAREAYFLKQLAQKLGREISHSKDVQNLSSLIGDSARELERTWRMAACISNTPVSTAYPYLPTMPTGTTAIKVPPPATPETSAPSATAQAGMGGDFSNALSLVCSSRTRPEKYSTFI